jgi:hypothetical protein
MKTEIVVISTYQKKRGDIVGHKQLRDLLTALSCAHQEGCWIARISRCCEAIGGGLQINAMVGDIGHQKPKKGWLKR